MEPGSKVKEPMIIAAARVRVAWYEMLMTFGAQLMRWAGNARREAQYQITEWEQDEGFSN